MKYLSIYVHIPFCKSKCYYCSFCSFANSEKIYEEYFKTLNYEIENSALNYKNNIVNTIFIGSGTPSVVPAIFIENLIKNIKKHYILSKNCEISIDGREKGLFVVLKNINENRKYFN